MKFYRADEINWVIEELEKNNDKIYKVEPIKIIPYKTIKTEEEMKKLVDLLDCTFYITKEKDSFKEEIRKIVNNEKISGIEAKLMIKDLLEKGSDK